MGQRHNKIRLPAPWLLLAIIETAVFAAIPFVAASVLGRDLPGIEIPSPTQILVFTFILVLTMTAMGLYGGRHRGSPFGDLSRSTWAFALAGAGLAMVAELWSDSGMRFSVTVLALTLGFFIQRTLRLVFFDAVLLPGEPDPRVRLAAGSGYRMHQ